MERLANISQFEFLMNTKTQRIDNTLLDKIKGAWRWGQERAGKRAVHDVHEMMKEGISHNQQLMRRIGMGMLWLTLLMEGHEAIKGIPETQRFLDNIKTNINRCVTTEELKTLHDMVFKTRPVQHNPVAMEQLFIQRQRELGQDPEQNNKGHLKMPWE